MIEIKNIKHTIKVKRDYKKTIIIGIIINLAIIILFFTLISPFVFGEKDYSRDLQISYMLIIVWVAVLNSYFNEYIWRDDYMKAEVMHINNKGEEI